MTASRRRSVPYLVSREGRYWARVVVPADVRKKLGKRELRAPLGADRREALRTLPLHVSSFLDEIATARRETEADVPARITRPLSRSAMAWLHYREELANDDAARNEPDRASVGAPELFRGGHASALRKVAAGRAEDDEIAAVIGWAVEKFKGRGNSAADRGTPEWRELARTLAMVQLEGIDRAGERDRGDFNGAPSLPILAERPAELDQPAPVKLLDLLDAYLNERARFGKGAEARRRWTPVFRDFIRHLEHDDAARVTEANVIEWMEKRLQTLSPKTVRDTDLGALRAVFGWAKRRKRIETNPVADVKLEGFKRQLTREKGFTLPEATAILKATRTDHSEKRNLPGRDHRIAAKRWFPWLCAHTGARVGEIAQLRKEDVREADGIHFIRITPDAGTVKTGHYRDVPLHPQLIEEGFLDFVAGAASGPLFYGEPVRRKPTAQHGSRTTYQNVSKWVRKIEGTPAKVAPSHGWRHRFKTVGREVGIDSRILDALQGHAPVTAGDDYGDLTLRAKAASIAKIPKYEIR